MVDKEKEVEVCWRCAEGAQGFGLRGYSDEQLLEVQHRHLHTMLHKREWCLIVSKAFAKLVASSYCLVFELLCFFFRVVTARYR
jgi:hypothetical protein